MTELEQEQYKVFSEKFAVEQKIDELVLTLNVLQKRRSELAQRAIELGKEIQEQTQENPREKLKKVEEKENVKFDE